MNTEKSFTSLKQFKDTYLPNRSQRPILSGEELGKLAAERALEKIRKDLARK
jgi:hypothetical protein